MRQAAKTTLFAAGNEADVRKKRLGDFFPMNQRPVNFGVRFSVNAATPSA
jgi:hypothetical protein